MLASISPLGERARRQPWAITVAAHVIASTVGGASAGALLGGIGALTGVEPTTGAVLAVAALCAAAMALDAAGVRPPGPRRQVDERWLDRYRGWVYGAGFGFQLGVVAVTIVTTWAQWATLAIALVTGSPVAGAVVGGAYGILRALPLLGLRRVHDPAALRQVHVRFQRWRRPAAGAGHAVLGLVAVALAATVAA